MIMKCKVSMMVHTVKDRVTPYYAIIWILTGLSCLVVGEMLYPGANQTISDIGASWFGISVAAGYSYFGVNP